MIDEAQRLGLQFDLPRLVAAVTVKTEPLKAGEGRITERMAVLFDQAQIPSVRVSYPEQVEKALCALAELLGGAPIPPRALGLLLLAGNLRAQQMLESEFDAETADKARAVVRKAEQAFRVPLYTVITSRRLRHGRANCRTGYYLPGRTRCGPVAAVRPLRLSSAVWLAYRLVGNPGRLLLGRGAGRDHRGRLPARPSIRRLAAAGLRAATGQPALDVCPRSLPGSQLRLGTIGFVPGAGYRAPRLVFLLHLLRLPGGLGVSATAFRIAGSFVAASWPHRPRGPAFGVRILLHHDGHSQCPRAKDPEGTPDCQLPAVVGLSMRAMLAVMLLVLEPLPWTAAATLFGTLFVQVLITGILANAIIPGGGSDFILELSPIRMPRLRAVLNRARQQSWQFLEGSVAGLYGCFLLALCSRSIGWTGRPGTVLPPRAQRRARLARTICPGIHESHDSARERSRRLTLVRNHFTSLQLVVTLFVITVMLPCVNSAVVLLKEQGIKVSVLLLLIIGLYALLVCAGLNWGCHALGITFQ